MTSPAQPSLSDRYDPQAAEARWYRQWNDAGVFAPDLVAATTALLDLIVERVAELNRQGTTFLIIEHNMDLVASLCRPVMVMAQGCLLAQGEAAQVLADPRVVEAYLGEAA